MSNQQHRIPEMLLTEPVYKYIENRLYLCVSVSLSAVLSAL
jgi:hypothetical protein